MFGAMMQGDRQDFVQYVMHVQVTVAEPKLDTPTPIGNLQYTAPDDPGEAPSAMADAAAAPQAAAEGLRGRRPRRSRRSPRPPVVKSEWDKTPRNAPCPCGQRQEVQALPRPVGLACTDAGLLRRPRRASAPPRRGATRYLRDRRAAGAPARSSRPRLSRPDLWDDPDRGPARSTASCAGVHRRPRALRRARRPASTTPRRCRAGPRGGRRVPRGRDRRRRRRARARSFDELELRALFTGEHDERDAIVRDPLRCGRRRRPGLGRDAAAHVPALGRAPRASTSSSTRSQPGTEAGISLGHVPGQGPLRLRPAAGRARRAPPGAHLAVRRPGASARPPSPSVDGHAVPRGRRRRSRSTRRTCASTPTGRRAPAASTST